MIFVFRLKTFNSQAFCHKLFDNHHLPNSNEEPRSEDEFVNGRGFIRVSEGYLKS